MATELVTISTPLIGEGALPQAVGVSPSGRFFASITGLMTISERGNDKLTITKHPVAVGASITDHAYLEPAELQLTMMSTNSTSLATSDDYVQQVYANLLALQKSRQPFSIQTGKRLYENMLMETLGLTTDQRSENALMLQIGCKQIILVSTSVTLSTNALAPPVPADPDLQADPEKTATPVASGTKQPDTVTAPAPGSWMAKAAALATPTSLELAK